MALRRSGGQEVRGSKPLGSTILTRTLGPLGVELIPRTLLEVELCRLSDLATATNPRSGRIAIKLMNFHLRNIMVHRLWLVVVNSQNTEGPASGQNCKAEALRLQVTSVMQAERTPPLTTPWSGKSLIVASRKRSSTKFRVPGIERATSKGPIDLR